MIKFLPDVGFEVQIENFLVGDAEIAGRNGGPVTLILDVPSHLDDWHRKRFNTVINLISSRPFISLIQ